MPLQTNEEGYKQNPGNVEYCHGGEEIGMLVHCSWNCEMVQMLGK